MYYLAMYLYEATTRGLFTTESIPFIAAFFVGIGVFFFLPAIRNLIFKGEVEGLLETGMKKVQKRKAARSISDANLTAETDVEIK